LDIFFTIPKASEIAGLKFAPEICANEKHQATAENPATNEVESATMSGEYPCNLPVDSIIRISNAN
jgi:hypothetical protein